jgi:predicted AlkP superfamily phosphohydrolase/phosphomutase
LLPAAAAPALLALAALLLAATTAMAAPARRMVVLGVDGMDPVMLRQYMAEGVTPNLAKLAENGSFVPLGTSIPPQSPVAWSDFITGLDPGGHGLFDFLALDRATLTPYLSASTVEKAKLGPLTFGRWRLPLAADRTVLLRDGRAFWEILDEHGIAARLFQVPANYPPVAAAESLSGMGTPDLRGTPGTFTWYTDDPGVQAGPVAGGVVRRARLRGGVLRGQVEGPPNPFLAGQPAATVDFELRVDAGNPVALVRFGDQQALLNVGEWSDWLRVNFELVPGLVSVPGMVRVHLQQVRPRLALYVSPVNIDPRDPAQPIAHPAEYAFELAEAAGPFYTKEMPEETKALSAGLISGEEFLAQTDIVLDERRRLLRHELQRFRESSGDRFLFFYLSTVDQRNHMLAREMDPAHPFHAADTPAVLSDAMRNTYREVDELVGQAQAALPAETTLVVMSDHGFAPFRRQANLNTWLEQQGYLRLMDPARRDQYDWLAGIDWARTRAFAIGLNSLYINVRGRERDGSVEPAARQALAREIAAKLLEWRDGPDGPPVVTQAAVREDVYHGEHVEAAPDVIVGYAWGYRSSWATATGGIPAALLTDNDKPWSGDHCMDSRSVPGVLLVNRPLRMAAGQGPATGAGGQEDREAAMPAGQLRDLPVTILDYFGIAPAPGMTGRALF